MLQFFVVVSRIARAPASPGTRRPAGGGCSSLWLFQEVYIIVDDKYVYAVKLLQFFVVVSESWHVVVSGSASIYLLRWAGCGPSFSLHAFIEFLMGCCIVATGAE